MIENRDLYNIPASVAIKLEQELPKVNEFLKYKPDFPHQEWHIQGVVRDVLFAAEVMGLDREETELTRLVAETHDEGYKAVQAGLLKPEEHHFGSYLVAKARYSEEVALGALLHNSDVMPNGVPYAYKLVRDVDRLHFLGWGGLVRAAYYQGFRPFGMVEGDTEAAGKAAALFETRTPAEENAKVEVRADHCFPHPVRNYVQETDYERRVKVYAWLHVFPSLSKAGKLEVLENNLRELHYAWEAGESYYGTPGNNFVPKGEVYNPAKVVYAVEPIADDLQVIFGARLFNSYDAVRAIDVWKDRHPGGIARRPKLEHQWAKEPYWHE